MYMKYLYNVRLSWNSNVVYNTREVTLNIYDIYTMAVFRWQYNTWSGIIVMKFVMLIISVIFYYILVLLLCHVYRELSGLFQ